MARIRSIKPETPDDEKLANCSREARLLFIYTWTLCDDHGRFRASPRYLRTKLFPYDNDLDDDVVAGWLKEIEAEGRIHLYEVGGERYGFVVNWKKHQRISNAGNPLYPAPPNLAEICGEPPKAALGAAGRDSARFGEMPPETRTPPLDHLPPTTYRDKDHLPPTSVDGAAVAAAPVDNPVVVEAILNRAAELSVSRSIEGGDEIRQPTKVTAYRLREHRADWERQLMRWMSLFEGVSAEAYALALATGHPGAYWRRAPSPITDSDPLSESTT